MKTMAFNRTSSLYAYEKFLMKRDIFNVVVLSLEKN